MRRLGDGVEAALHCTLVLAALDGGKVLSGKSLAELHGLSESYLLKHLRSLSKANIIEATSGPRGGFRLARDPAAISMWQVVEAIDGNQPAFLCREIRQQSPWQDKLQCSFDSDCFIKTRMLKAELVWRDALKTQTIADLLSDGEQQIDVQSQKALREFIERHQR